MPILRNIPIPITPAEILGRRKKRANPPHVLQAAEEAIALAQALWQPVALYEWLDVVAIEGHDVRVSGPLGEGLLDIGPRAGLLDPARQVVVAVGTLGFALERRVHELTEAGQALNALLLDSAGVVAVGAIGEAMRCLAEETAVGQGWGVSPSLAPGSLVGWSVEGQSALCGLLPLEEIGVTLNSFGILEPFKSASWLIGIGPGYEARHVGSMCYLCALSDTCWRRREDRS